MDYNRLVENALRGVVRAALEEVAENGLVGNHHFYISFDTGFPGVEIADYLRQRYAGEMTIVLQHQYWDLFIGEDGFAISLSFNKKPERLRIPFAAVTAFADPSVQFGLQFKVDDPETAAPATTLPTAQSDNQPGAVRPAGKAGAKQGGAEPAAAAADDDPGAPGAPGAPGPGEVISLDSFRKK